MFKKLSLLVFALLTMASISSAETAKFAIDPVHSHIGFKVKHMIISTVDGKFDEFDGFIMFDENDITKSSVEVNIEASSIDTDNANRDKHLRSEDFFYVEKYPTITFKSTKIEKKKDQLYLYGELTMRGVTKPIEIPFVFNGQITDPQGNIRIGFDAEAALDRQDFGISWNKMLDTGGLVVSDNVFIELSVEAVKQ